MRLQRLEITNVRIIHEAATDTDAPLIVLVGDNASGKTSYLEAIYSLLCGRSFRTRQGSQLISQGEESFLVRAMVQGSDSIHARIASEVRTKQAPRFRLNSEDIRPSVLAARYPVQLIDASLFDLITGSPSHRRRFFDWGMFHVKQEFYPLWKKHRKLAANWNALLRRGAKLGEFDYWRQPLIDTSERLAAIRQEYARELEELLCGPQEGGENQKWFGGSLSIKLDRGWSESLGYEEFLRSSMEKDLRYKRLQAGAQFFDLGLFLGGRPVKEILSRGQMKLLGLKLKLAQIKLYNALPSRDSCLVLVDDLAAEVDKENQKSAIREILGAGSQVFFTAVDRSHFEEVIPEQVDCKMFHVKQGVITQIY